MDGHSLVKIHRVMVSYRPFSAIKMCHERVPRLTSDNFKVLQVTTQNKDQIIKNSLTSSASLSTKEIDSIEINYRKPYRSLTSIMKKKYQKNYANKEMSKDTAGPYDAVLKEN